MANQFLDTISGLPNALGLGNQSVFDIWSNIQTAKIQAKNAASINTARELEAQATFYSAQALNDLNQEKAGFLDGLKSNEDIKKILPWLLVAGAAYFVFTKL